MVKNSRILWEGNSLIDGSPIVVVVTGLLFSSNPKTGDILQVYILPRDINPAEAVATGTDQSVCGSCKFSGGKGCYVNIGQAPLSVWKAYKRGRYAQFTDADKTLITGRVIRFGAYGDPAAVPYFIWYNLMKYVKSHTGYTHQVLSMGLGEQWQFLMASADTEQERTLLQGLGWRTFTTYTNVAYIPTSDVICPASKEGGFKATCQSCKLCTGNKTKAKSVGIVIHGSVNKVTRATRAINKSTYYPLPVVQGV